jgi:Cytochrome c oxidase subunit IV
VRSLGPDVTLFARMAAFGLIVGAVYWFLTYEVAGTVLLSTFGLASAIAGIAVFVGSRRLRRTETEATPADNAVPATADVEPLPRPGWAPLGIALGLGAVAIGAAFGPWLAIAGALLAIRSAKSWLDAAVRETDEARRRSTDAEPAGRRSGRR